MKRATGADDSIANPDNAISIHALVKRATGADKYKLPVASISIHALVKRATKIAEEFMIGNTFQSTPS